MKDENDNILKRLIQQAGPETPPPDFTDFVMNSVQLDAQSDFVVNSELRSVLQQRAIEKPSADFLLRVMSQVEVQQMAVPSRIIAEPIISRRMWYTVAAACIALVSLLGFYYKMYGDSSTVSSKVTLTDKAISLIASGVSTMPSMYTLSLIVIAGLLLMDYFLRNRVLRRVV